MSNHERDDPAWCSYCDNWDSGEGCINGNAYGWCLSEFCYGMCEFFGSCTCQKCHGSKEES